MFTGKIRSSTYSQTLDYAGMALQGKHSSLMGPFINWTEKSFIKLAPGYVQLGKAEGVQANETWPGRFVT